MLSQSIPATGAKGWTTFLTQCLHSFNVWFQETSFPVPIWDQSLTTEIIKLIISTHNHSSPSWNVNSGYATLLQEILGTRVRTSPFPLSNQGKGIEYCVNNHNISMTSSCVSVLQELKVKTKNLFFFSSFLLWLHFTILKLYFAIPVFDS